MQLFNNPFSELGSLNELCGIRCIRPVVYMSNWKGRLGCKGFNIGSAAFSITLCRVVVRVRSYLPFPSAVKGIHSEANGIGTGCPVRNSGSSVRLGAATACVCPPPSTTRERKIEFFKITIGPQEVRWY